MSSDPTNEIHTWFSSVAVEKPTLSLHRFDVIHNVDNFCVYKHSSKKKYIYIQGGSNMTGTDCV
jgi:hypothetical protein